jgi:hypothetical protein
MFFFCFVFDTNSGLRMVFSMAFSGTSRPMAVSISYRYSDLYRHDIGCLASAVGYPNSWVERTTKWGWYYLGITALADNYAASLPKYADGTMRSQTGAIWV